MLLMVIFPIYPMVRYCIPWGWRSADDLLQPRHSPVPSNATLNGLQRARTIVGFLLVTSTTLRYDENGVDAVLDQLGAKIGLTLLVGLLALVGGIAVFAANTAPGPARQELLSRAVRYPPIMIAYAAGIALSMYLTELLIPIDLAQPNLIITLVLVVVQFVVGGFAIGFWLRGLFLLGKNVFNAVEVHPLLPAALAPVIAWALGALELIQGSSTPVRVQLLLTVSGAITVTVLAAMEWQHYQKTFGITVRTGPHPPRTGPSQHP